MNVVACPLDNYPVAPNTFTTPITSTLTGLLVNEKSSLAGISASGDWWLDEDVGVLFVYSAGGSTLPALTGAETITYFYYAGSVSTVSKFASVVATSTALQPGDFLKCDSNSNFVRADPSTDGFHIMGQVLGFLDFSSSYLKNVRTAYNPAISTNAAGGMGNAQASSASVNAGQLDRMTGSATGGIPSQITYAGGADKLVIVNMISR
jgi:hypothetical protein